MAVAAADIGHEFGNGIGGGRQPQDGTHSESGLAGGCKMGLVEGGLNACGLLGKFRHLAIAAHQARYLFQSAQIEKQLHFRRMMHYPPFSAMANILVRAEKKEVAMRLSTELGMLLSPPPEQLRILGPAEAPVPRLKNEYRYQFLVKAASRKVLNELVPRPRLRPGTQVGRHSAGDRCRPADPDVGGRASPPPPFI